MPRTLLFEVGFLGLPRDLFGKTIPDISSIVSKVLAEQRLEYSRVRTWFSEKRIGVLIDAIASSQDENIKEVRGPKISAAYDLNNMPTPAALGFASAQGLELKDLYTKEIDGNKFLCAPKTSVGKPLEEALPSLPEIIFDALPFQVDCWSKKSCFPQPPLYFCSMIDDATLDVTFEGLSVTNQSYFMSGLKQSSMKLEHASDYPMLMSKAGVLFDLSDRLKVIESRIMSALPENYRLRKNTSLFSKIALFAENPDPLFLSFNDKFLALPESILEEVFSGRFGYLICEDGQGKMLSGVVSLPYARAELLLEKKMREKFLEEQLEPIYKQWESDAQLDLSVLFDEAKNEFDDNKALADIVHWLVDNLQLSIPQESINEVLTWINVGTKLSISSVLPQASLSSIANLIEIDDNNQSFSIVLKEIDALLRNKSSLAKNDISKVFAVSLSLSKYMGLVEEIDSIASIKEIIKILNVTCINIDVFKCIQDLFPQYTLDRDLWISELVGQISLVQSKNPIISSVHYLGALDPNSFAKAMDEWKGDQAPKLGVWSDLHYRLNNLVKDIKEQVVNNPETELEIELNTRLDLLEKMPGINYIEISSFFKENRVDIEACLMNLPAVLDAVDETMTARIALIQRLNRQLSRLPFPRKEKKQKRIETEKKAVIL